MNVLPIIEKYYNKDTDLYNILLSHSSDVTNKALQIAQNHPELNIDQEFIGEAGMLHDIGIFETDAPSIKCYGKLPYIQHGEVGYNLLTKEGMPKHALVCLRHTGAGLSKVEITEQNLPLEHIDMLPISIEEQVICFADCFFSKTKLGKEKSTEKIRNSLSKFGERSVKQFDKWCELFL